MPGNEFNSDNPFDLYREIGAADSPPALKAIGVRMLYLAEYALQSRVGTRHIVQLISRFNDAITLRLIALLERNEGVCLPEGATFLVLGSEGRGEQTLRTDQDNAIVYDDALSAEQLYQVKLFAGRLVDALEEAGVPRCRGNIMASNPRWCHGVSEWKQLLKQWISVPTPGHILSFGMFQDLRALYGGEAPVKLLREYICTEVQCHANFFPNMATHVVRFPAPFTLFGRIRVEHSGPAAGTVDLKKGGIFAITTGASLLALEYGIVGGDTWEKLTFLGHHGFFTDEDRETIQASFTFLVRLRLQQQLRELSSGREPTNSLDPHQMSSEDYEQFRQALKGVNVFLWIFRDHYHLDYISM